MVNWFARQWFAAYLGLRAPEPIPILCQADLMTQFWHNYKIHMKMLYKTLISFYSFPEDLTKGQTRTEPVSGRSSRQPLFHS